MPLAMLGRGESGVISALAGSPESVKHLADLGFVNGETVRVITELQGNLIIEVKGSRLAINRVMANRIQVEEMRG